MDTKGILAAVTSISSPGDFFGNKAHAIILARFYNEISAKLISDHPSCFGAFAALPLAYIESSLSGLVCTREMLGLDGFVVLTSYEGKYIGAVCLMNSMQS
ncbi:hypothetical protein EG833_03250 [archaeon]|nr:hypothetical protein [archaeon]